VGCDHHSAKGPQPCNCDYCARDLPVPERMRTVKVNNWGLHREWGPDPRSHKAARGTQAYMTRNFLGLGM
jgi:hypothetical protein